MNGCSYGIPAPVKRRFSHGTTTPGPPCVISRTMKHTDLYSWTHVVRIAVTCSERWSEHGLQVWQIQLPRQPVLKLHFSWAASVVAEKASCQSESLRDSRWWWLSYLGPLSPKWGTQIESQLQPGPGLSLAWLLRALGNCISGWKIICLFSN